MKTCLQCGETKPVESFYRKADNADGRFNVCKPCHAARYRPELLDTKKYYVYEHVRPDTGQVFYVGKGCGGRAEDVRGRKNAYWLRIVAKLARKGLTHETRITHFNLTEGNAFVIESARINFWRERGAALCNFTDGGEGFRGLRRTEEHCRKISESLRGRKLSPEHAEKSRTASLGRKQTPEEMEQRRVANALRPRNDEQKRRMRDAHTVEQLTKRSLTVIRRTKDMERAEVGRNKKCIRCEQIKDLAHFTKRKSSVDGFHVYCRDCKNAINRAQKSVNNKFGIDYGAIDSIDVRRRVTSDTPLTGRFKKCLTCKETKDAVHFSQRAKSVDGLQYHCKSCQSLKYAANKK